MLVMMKCTCQASQESLSLIDRQLVQFAHHLMQHVDLDRGPDTRILSPQMSKHLIQMLTATYIHPDGKSEFVNRIRSLFQRLLFELIQAHMTTKQREVEFKRLITKKRAEIDSPQTTDAVISTLIKLFKAANPSKDSALPRRTIIEFLYKDLKPLQRERAHIDRIFQTLYSTGCLDIYKGHGVPARMELKHNLASAQCVRRQHDLCLINMALQNNIRLPPESLAHLLYNSDDPDVISRMQSYLNQCSKPVTVDELQSCMIKFSDPHEIEDHMTALRQIEQQLTGVDTELRATDTVVASMLEQLFSVIHLFSVRQQRSKIRI